jgi:hypothetical protein
MPVARLIREVSRISQGLVGSIVATLPPETITRQE